MNDRARHAGIFPAFFDRPKRSAARPMPERSSWRVPRSLGWLGLVMLASTASLGCQRTNGDDSSHVLVEQRHGAAVNALQPVPVVGLPCGEVSSRADACAAQCPSDIRKIQCLIGCKDDGRSQGCESALDVFDELTGCIQRKCLIECMGGPSPDCRQCTEQSCTEQAQQCHTHTCQPARARNQAGDPARAR
jgi:hypothetical protein